jgi:hypothetical protein
MAVSVAVDLELAGRALVRLRTRLDGSRRVVLTLRELMEDLRAKICIRRPARGVCRRSG